MNRVLRGIGVNGPAKHFLWKRWMEIVEPSFEIDPKTHLTTPTCRVEGDRKYECTISLEQVTCRACLRAMAMRVHDEETWRRQIIRCAQVMERKGAVKENDLSEKTRKALSECKMGIHTIRKGRCLDCEVVVYPV